MTGWLSFALLSAVAAAATAILAKLGTQGVPASLATAVRTTVVLVFSWGIALGTGQARGLSVLSGRNWLFLTLSGIATGVSWLAYFQALKLGPASRVAPIDKTSLALTIVLAALVLGEPVTWKVWAGAALMLGGALLTLG
jgi:transporter family protein